MKKQISAVLAAAFIMSTAASVLAAPVTDLVNKTTFNGDIRVRYDIVSKDNGTPDDDIMKYRLRLNVTNKLSDKLTANLRFTNGENEFGQKDGKFVLDRYNLSYKSPDYKLVIGRQDIQLFEGLAVNLTKWAGEDTKDNRLAALEGLTATTKFGDVNATAYFGQITDQKPYDAATGNKFDTQGLALSTNIEKVNVGVALVEVGAPQGTNFDKKFTTFAANTQLTKDLYFGTEFVSGLNADKDQAWTALLSYGKLQNVGDVNYQVQYKDVDRNALQKYNTDSWKSSSKDYTFWSVSAIKKLANDLEGKLYYENYDYNNGGTDQNTTRLDLVVKF